MVQRDLRRSSVGQALWRCVFLMATAGAACGGSLAQACDTPVFRFAMYSPQWAPWPYTVCCLQVGEAPPEARRVNEKLKATADDEASLANLQFKSVDPTDEQVVAGLPPSVRKLCREDSAKRPRYAIVNPRRDVVYAGDLAEGDLAALLDSPARKRLSQLMAQGNIVFLLLEGRDAETSRAAEETVQNVMRLVADGKLDDLLRPAAAPAAPPGSPAAPSVTPKVALLKVARGDAQESWLVRMLMRTDDDLDEVADQPMVFPIYGRARALPPCIGKGITKENLLDRTTGLAFLSGPCSCEAKDGNPGTDLLTAVDWPAVAAAMAEVYGDEESAAQMGDVTSLVPRLNGGGKGAGVSGQARPQSAAGGSGGLVDLAPPSEAEMNVAAPNAADGTTNDVESPMLAAGQSLRMVGMLIACMAVAAVVASLAFFIPRGR